MEIKDFLIGFIVIALFVIAMISFGVNLGSENNSNISINDDAKINTLYSGVNGTIYNYGGKGGTIQDEANSSFGAITSENPVTGAVQDLFFASIGFVAKTVSGVSYTLFGSIFDPLLKIILPNSPEVRKLLLIIISTSIMFLLALLVWKLYRTGT